MFTAHCDPPPSVANSEDVTQAGGYSTALGTTVTIQCLQGYGLPSGETNVDITCESAGDTNVWSEENIGDCERE